MPRLREAPVNSVEGSYGWCGLCHAFTEFPHECPGEFGPLAEDAA